MPSRPSRVEPLIAQLKHSLPSYRLVGFNDALERFNFAEAEAALRRLALELDISLEC